jgi:20S proteasome alpha/beta subunit
MTLVIALKARDGVVLVSDGQATVDDDESLVRTRIGANKLDDLHGVVAFGCSGQAGLQQRVAQALKAEVTPEHLKLAIDDLRPHLLSIVNRVQKEALDEHVSVREGALPANIEVLFCGYSGGEPWVYEINMLGHDEVHPHGEAIGHARHFPAYLMVSTLHYRLLDRGVEQVTILAYRAVADAIKTDASALGPPIHAYIVTDGGALRLDEDRLKAIEETLNGWKQQEHDIFRELLAPEASPADSSPESAPQHAPGVTP